MKVTVGKEALSQALQMAMGIVAQRTTLPILSNVLVQAEKGRLLLTATDLEVSVRCAVDAEVQKTGATTLPARRLASIVRELAVDQVTAEVDEKNVATISCGSSLFRILGMAEEDFPPLPKLEGGASYGLNQGIFKEMLKKIAYSASSDETRYILNGVLLSFKNEKLTAVATDGKRLALAEQEVEFPKEAEADMVLPSKTVTALIHSLQDDGPLKIHAVKNQMAFEFGSTLVVSKLIDGTYPNFKQVIPSESEKRIALDREALLTALRRVSLVTTEKQSTVKLTFAKNQLKINAESADIGEAHETLAVKYAGDELTVAFNPEFLMDPLKNITDDEVFLELTDELSPGVVKCHVPFLYVLMPIRVT